MVYENLFDDNTKPTTGAQPAAPAGGQPNKFDNLFDDDDAPARIRANAALQFGIEAQPDTAARNQALAKRYGVPPALVETFKPDYDAKAKLDDARAVVDQSPKLRSWLADDLDRAKVVHDDVSNLAAVGHIAGDLGVMSLKAAVGLPQMVTGILDIPTFGYFGKGLDLAGVRFNDAQSYLSTLYSDRQQAANKAVSSAEGFGGTLVAGLNNPTAVAATIGESVPQMLGGGLIARSLMGIGAKVLGTGVAGPALPGWLARTFGTTAAPIVAGAAGEGVVGAGSAAEQYRGQTADGLLTPQQALAAVGSGAGTALFSVIGGKLANKLGVDDLDTALARGALSPADVEKGLWRSLAEGGISEGLFEELPQSAQEQVWQNFALDQPLLDGVGNAAATGLMAGGIAGGAFNGMHAQLEKRMQSAHQAETTAVQFQQLGELAKASKVLARDPDTFESFIAHATQDGPAPNVFIDAKALMQSGVAEQVAALSPAVAAQYQTALATGGDIQIPVAEYATRLAGTDLNQHLLDHLKVDPLEPSRAEAREFMQSHADEFKAEAERVLAEKQGDETFKQSADAVKADIRAQLDKTGRFTGGVHDTYATLVSNFFAVQAAKLGITPQELYARHPLKVQAESVTGGGVLNQDGGAFKLENTGGTTRNAKAGDTTISYSFDGERAHIASVRTPSAKRNKGSARAAMSQFLREADALGVPVVLESSPLDKRTKDGRLYHFYKSLGFEPTGRKINAAGDPEMLRHPQQLNQSPTLPDTINIDGKERPTLNSNGQPIHPTEEGVRNFWKWFGDSKVVDAKGRPLVVYHGTDSQFDTFDRSKAGNGPSKFGFWFADDQGFTEMFGSNPMASYLEAGRLKEITKGQWDTIRGKHARDGEWFANWEKELSSQGFKGLRVVGGTEMLGRHEVRNPDIYAVFSPEQTKSATGNTGEFDPTNPNILNQGVKNRGSFSPSTNTITLLKNADLSTFLHELGHFFLETQFNIAAQIQQEAGIFGADTNMEGQSSLLSDTNALLKWFGINSLDEWHSLDFEEMRHHHEQFARGFEAYLFEGKAPSIELQGVFQRFRAFIISAYKNILKMGAAKTLDVQLTDEVRSVMDRMIASTEDIKLAEQARSMMPLFTSAGQEAAPADFAAYQALGVDATNDAIQYVQARGLRDLAWSRNARGREIKKLQKAAEGARAQVEAEVRRGVMAQPIYQAWQFLTSKQQEGGNPAGKINTDDLKSSGIPAEITKHIQNLRMTSPNGVHPDVVAEMFGFSSGDELVRTLAAAQKPADEIEGLTDARMLEEHGELATQDAIERAADIAIHNENRARVVATEANALAKATGKHKILASAAREFAANMISRLKVRDIRPGRYSAADARAAKAARKASEAGDLATAGIEKRNQLLNIYATRAAYEAQEEVAKAHAFFKTITTGRDDVVGKTRDLDIVNAARAVLGHFGYAGKAKSATDYLKAVQEYDPDLYAVLRASVDNTAQVGSGSIQDLTVEQVRALRDEMEAFWYLAKSSRQMEIDGDMLDRQDAADMLRARMDEIGVPESGPGDVSAVTPAEERAMVLASTVAAAKRAEFWVDLKDGPHQFGAFRRVLFTPIKEAADRYRAARVVALRDFRNSFSAIAPSLKPGLISSHELNYTFGKDSGGSALNEILHAIIHTGNESNQRKLLLGRGWATETAEGVVDTSRWDAFISRLVAEGKLTAEHYAFAQSVWDQNETLKPLAQKAHRDAYGRYFSEVTARPFVDPFGIQRRGGYAPAQVDSRIVKDNELKKLIEEGKDGMAYAFPGAGKGFTNARVEYNRPLLLDLRTLPQHMDKVLLFSHMEIPVRNAAKLLASKSVSVPLNKLDPAAISGLLMPWLNRSARQQVTTPVAGASGVMRMLNTLKNRTSMSMMIANVSNTAQQITGFMLAGLKVKPSHLLSAAAAYMKAPRKTAEQVAEMSSYMANRMSNEVRAMMGEIDAILLNPSLIERGQEWTKRHTFFLQSAMDNVMGPIIWTGAYNQALEQGASLTDAARLADAAIRMTQGSTLPEDVSRMETGPVYARIFTQFTGYFNMQANLVGTEFAKVSQEMGLRKGMGRGFYILLLGFYAPALVAEGIAQAFRGGPGDDDKDGEYLDDWLMSLLVYGPMRNATAFVPFVGQAINSAVARFNHNPTDDKVSVAPVVGAIEGAAGAPFDLYKTAAGEGNAQRTVKDVATLISITTGLPASLAARPVSYLAGLVQGKVAPTSAADAARGLVTGAASPESKQK